MSEIEIPEAAIRVACGAYEGALLDETPRGSALDDHEEIVALRAAAPLIVAAELRRIEQVYRERGIEARSAARLHNGGARWIYESACAVASELSGFAAYVKRRADELDPEGGRS